MPEDPTAIAPLLRQAARTGQVLDFAPEVEDRDLDLDPAWVATWPSERCVSGELLRTVLLETDLCPDPRGLRLRGAVVTGTLDLSYVTVRCPLAVTQSRFEQPAQLRYSTLIELNFSDSHMPGLDLLGMRVHGDILLDGIHVTGGVCAMNARVTGLLGLVAARLTSEGPIALNLGGAYVDGGALFGGLSASGEVLAIGAHITGHFDLRRATLSNEGGKALSLDGISIDGVAFLEGLVAAGEVRALGAHVTGDLNLQGARLTNESGKALNLDRIRVDGGAFLSGLVATGEVRALGAHITAEFNFMDAVLTNQGGEALNLDGISVDGGAFLSRLVAIGEVRARNSHITGQLDLNGAKLTNEGNTALDIDKIRVDGSAIARGLMVTGALRAPGAHITGQFDLTGAALANDGGHAVSFENLVARVLILRGLTISRGSFYLVSAKIEDVIVDNSPVGQLPGPLEASGWQIRDIHGAPRTDRKAAVAWLATQPAFVAQPWHALADVYERNGQPADARLLRYRAAKRTTKNAPCWSKPPRWAYGALVGYGYYPLIAGAWLLVALLMATLIVGAQKGTFVPTNAVTAAQAVAQAVPKAADTPMSVTVTGSTECAQLAERYPCLRAFSYSLDVVLPLTATTGQATAWRTTAAWVAHLLTILKTLCWLCAAVLLAGVTGLLRRT